jgi:hypothetical protein
MAFRRMAFSIMAFKTMVFSIMTFRTTAFSIMAFRTMAFSIMALNINFNIVSLFMCNVYPNKAQYDECL